MSGTNFNFGPNPRNKRLGVLKVFLENIIRDAYTKHAKRIRLIYFSLNLTGFLLFFRNSVDSEASF